jgi:GT2 family glycosyltransferase
MNACVDIVIPVHGAWTMTERCLDALRERDRSVRSVIVVDDASPDDTAARLRARDDIEAVILERNRGFAGACNAGAERVRAETVLFLNNDTIVQPGSIDRLVEALVRDETIGATGAKLLYPDGTVQSAGCGFTRGLGGTWRLYAHLDGSLPQSSLGGDYPYLAGAALLVRTELFRALGGFDERYRNGAEDVDLCLRIWQSGSRVHFVPEAPIVHLEGATRGTNFEESANWKHFLERWEARANDLPQYDPPRLPDLIVGLPQRSAFERALRAGLLAVLRRYAGMRLVKNDSAPVRALAMMRARLERKPLLRISGDARDHADIAWMPSQERVGVEAIRARRIWAPSAVARDRLIGSGIPPETVTIVRPGFLPRPITERAGVALIVDGDTDAALIAALRAALAPHAPTIADPLAASADELARILEARLVIFAAPGDPWGFIGGTALASGAVVIATPDAVFLETADARERAIVTTASDLAAAVAQYRDRAGSGASEATAALAGARVRELARSYCWGIPPPETLQMRASWMQTPAARSGAVNRT